MVLQLVSTYLLRCYSGYSPYTRKQHKYAGTAHAYVGGSKFGSTPTATIVKSATIAIDRWIYHRGVSFPTSSPYFSATLIVHKGNYGAFFSFFFVVVFVVFSL